MTLAKSPSLLETAHQVCAPLVSGPPLTEEAHPCRVHPPIPRLPSTRPPPAARECCTGRPTIVSPALARPRRYLNHANRFPPNEPQIQPFAIKRLDNCRSLVRHEAPPGLGFLAITPSNRSIV